MDDNALSIISNADKLKQLEEISNNTRVGTLKT